MEHKLILPDVLTIAHSSKLNATSSTNPEARCRELVETLKSRDSLINSLIKANNKLIRRVADLELKLGV